MPTATLTLTEFLLARIAEDEAAVDGMWSGSEDPDFQWGPDRIRLECAAKRAIVDMWPWGGESGIDVREEARAHLAAVYSDHPDYRAEWLQLTL